jgi:hypothetical protein
MSASTSYGSNPTGVSGTHYGGSGLGVLGANVPATGTNGPSIIYPGIALPAEAADEFRALILTLPPALPALRFLEDGSIVPTAAPDGAYSGTYRLYKNGVDAGSSNYTLTWGAGPVLTGAVTLDDAQAAGSLASQPASVLGGAVGLDDVLPAGTLVSVAPGTLTGGVTLDDVQASGSLASQLPASLSGAVTLDGAVASGGLVGSNTAPNLPPANVAFYPQRRFTVRHAVLDPLAQPDLSFKEPGEIVTLVWDFAPLTSVSAPTLELTRRGGADGLAPLLAVGAAYVLGARVLQRAGDGAAGSTYRVACTVTAPDGTQLTAAGSLPVRRA